MNNGLLAAIPDTWKRFQILNENLIDVVGSNDLMLYTLANITPIPSV